ncbi:uncharacterized protein MONBRDRAFT_34036 [Monosiga brevicollis MX1]|uniref:protein kinase C n=1 Tax=Monosiga brevicollis TaxID=81824 RepID=A9V9H6_MONBE|nr:uncharacterized protein MONBRDRAFT_34036 [Monosiga brevicollis MX1]EDQ85796.1 predicted protein [Monosiga brevicollis MX1]|eukprot:XP_001749275.1 hypothetical protein [Monosiga brevicollis MX1]
MPNSHCLAKLRHRRGVTRQGLRCLDCGLAVHERCHAQLLVPCAGLDIELGQEASRPHKFQVKSYTTPTFCQHCGQMLYGLLRQGVQCSECHVNAHRSCSQSIPALCGMDLGEERGRIRLAFQVDKDSNSIRVTVLECANVGKFSQADDKNLTIFDCYAKVCVQGLKAKSLKTSDLVSTTGNVRFDWTANMPIPAKLSKTQRIFVYIKSATEGKKKNIFLGGVSFAIDKILAGEVRPECWYYLLNESRGAFTNSAVLSDSELDSIKKQLEDADRVRRESRPSHVSRQNPFEGFKPLCVLGRGSFGKVVLVEDRVTKQLLALKMLKKTLAYRGDEHIYILNERRALALDNKPPFIVDIHSCFQTPSHLCFAMEYINGGDLMYHIQRQRRFTEPAAQFLLAEICFALWFLHEQHIIYRDLKLDNIMLTQAGHVKLCDLGMVAFLPGPDGHAKTFAGTPTYLAPEIIMDCPYTTAVDWWALGVLAFELLSGREPFGAKTDEEIYNKILRNRVRFPSTISPAGMTFIKRLLQSVPAKRLGKTRAEVQRDPFFAGLDWKAVEKQKVKPHFVPTAKSDFNVDDSFLKASVALTPDQDLELMEPTSVFDRFSFVNVTFA